VLAAAAPVLGGLTDGHTVNVVHHRCDPSLAATMACAAIVIACFGRDGTVGSTDEPSPIVNVEFHQTFAAHFQKEGLAGFLIHDIGTFHDLIDFERLLAKRIQDILPIIQHDYSLQPRNVDVPFRSLRA
jgi:hypothetical protein